MVEIIDKILDWGVAFILALVMVIIGVYIGILVTSNGTENKIAESSLYGGYSEVSLYQVYDRSTGVYYIVSEDGAISPLYNPDGSLRTVDNL